MYFHFCAFVASKYLMVNLKKKLYGSLLILKLNKEINVSSGKPKSADNECVLL